MTGLPPSLNRVHAVPAVAGIGLRSGHYRRVLDETPAIGWLEVHSENFFADGGMPAHVLEHARAQYPLSLHGVGLSLGSTDELDRDHLAKLKRLVDRYQPQLVSDHLCWSSVGGRHLHDLLPLPYTREAVDVLVSHIVQAQDALGRRILVENLSSYLELDGAEMSEPEFLRAITQRSGCGLLLDVNNVYVAARNHGFDARAYLWEVPHAAVEEIHLAGHRVTRVGEIDLLVDTHDQRVCPDVWLLYREALRLCGPVPTLIEWDSELPDLDVLLGEMRQADVYLHRARRAVAAFAAASTSKTGARYAVAA